MSDVRMRRISAPLCVCVSHFCVSQSNFMGQNLIISLQARNLPTLCNPEILYYMDECSSLGLILCHLYQANIAHFLEVLFLGTLTKLKSEY
jgi:hypothetical protein